MLMLMFIVYGMWRYILIWCKLRLGSFPRRGFLFSDICSRTVGRSKIPGGGVSSNLVGIICSPSPLIQIGLTYLPKSGEGISPLPSVQQFWEVEQQNCVTCSGLFHQGMLVGLTPLESGWWVLLLNNVKEIMHVFWDKNQINHTFCLPAQTA